MESLLAEFLEQLEIQRERLERCLARLSEESIWRRPRIGVNSIGNLCLHLAGNESHYVGHAIGGTGYARDRPSEFTTEEGVSAAELVARLRDAREATRAVLSGLSLEDLNRAVEADHPSRPTVLRLLLHVVEHYAYRTGPVVLQTRLY